MLVVEGKEAAAKGRLASDKLGTSRNGEQQEKTGSVFASHCGRPAGLRGNEGVDAYKTFAEKRRRKGQHLREAPPLQRRTPKHFMQYGTVARSDCVLRFLGVSVTVI